MILFKCLSISRCSSKVGSNGIILGFWHGAWPQAKYFSPNKHIVLTDEGFSIYLHLEFWTHSSILMFVP